MSDYESGVKDCELGVPAKLDASDEYLSGYSYQYQKEQIDDFFTVQSWIQK